MKMFGLRVIMLGLNIGGRLARLSLEDGGIDTETVDHEYFDHDVCW